MSVAVTIWVEEIDYRSIEIPNSRPARKRVGEGDQEFAARLEREPRTKRLTAAHMEVLKVLADHARHNGRAWPGEQTIGKESRRTGRQAWNLIQDLAKADLVKVHATKGGRHATNDYWVRVPWVTAPECVLELPKLPNDVLPHGARVQLNEDGTPKLDRRRKPMIDVESYVREARKETMKPVSWFPASDTQTTQPVSTLEAETTKPVAPFLAETMKPVSWESPSLREPPSPVESLSDTARERALENEGDNENGEPNKAPVQPTLPRMGALSAPGDGARVLVGDHLAEGKRIWSDARTVLLRAKLENTIELALRKTIAAAFEPDAGVLTLDGPLSDSDVQPDSAIAREVANAARGRALQLRMAVGETSSEAPQRRRAV